MIYKTIVLFLILIWGACKNPFFHEVEPPSGETFEPVSQPRDIFDRLKLVYKDQTLIDHLSEIMQEPGFIFHFSFEDSNNFDLQGSFIWDSKKEFDFLDSLKRKYPNNEIIVIFDSTINISIEKGIDETKDQKSLWSSNYLILFKKDVKINPESIQYVGRMELLLEKNESREWRLKDWTDIWTTPMDTSGGTIAGTWGRFKFHYGE